MQVSEIIERGMALAAQNERQDLRNRLGQALSRLRDPNVRVMVVGEFKQGKSQLVNALVNAPVCPVDDDIATSVPTTVRFGPEPTAAVLAAPPGTSLEHVASADLVRTPVPLDQVASLVSEQGNPANTRGISAVEVALPKKILTGGLALVDSPGVGGLNSVHSLVTLAAMPSAHALLLVTDASQEFTEPEMRFLQKATRICPNIAIVMTKIDLYPHWRQVAELNRGHLDRAGLQRVALFSVSSAMRIMAAQNGDAELNNDSGFPSLVRYIRGDVVGSSADVVRRSIAQDLRSTGEQIALSLNSELRALLNPEATPELIRQLENARERSDELRKQASKWQITLNDGVTDLLADLEYDLRDRMKRVQREAEESIDKGDPGPVWEQLVEWFEQRVAAAVSDTFVWTDERAKWLGEEVAEHFAEEAVALPSIKVDDTEGVLDPVERMGGIDNGKLSLFQKTFVSMRGSYGGVLMIGLVTGLVGMSLINPISLAAGVLLGGKAYRDDKAMRLQRRQAEAKMLVRRQVDDIVFQVGKQLKDRIRLVQRATRDHFTEIADEYHRSVGNSVQAAQKAAQMFSKEKDARVAEIRDELKQVEWLDKAASAVEPKDAPQEPTPVLAGEGAIAATPAAETAAAQHA